MLDGLQREQKIKSILFEMFAEFEEENKNKLKTFEAMRDEFVDYDLKTIVYRFRCELNEKRNS